MYLHYVLMQKLVEMEREANGCPYLGLYVNISLIQIPFSGDFSFYCSAQGLVTKCTYYNLSRSKLFSCAVFLSLSLRTVTMALFHFSKRKYLFISICQEFSKLTVTWGPQLRRCLEMIRNAKNQGLESDRSRTLEIVLSWNQDYFVSCAKMARRV